jgi:hypothetical protein
MISELLRWLLDQLKGGDDDAVVGALLAAISLVLDWFFFPNGLPSSTVGIVSGSLGYLFSRWLKNRSWLVERRLRRIDLLVKAGHLTRADAQRLKGRVILKWLKSTGGVEPETQSSDKLVAPSDQNKAE